MNRLFVFLLACVIAQFSYGQKELSIKEMENSMAQGNLNIQVDLATECNFTLELTKVIPGKVSDKKQWMFCGVGNDFAHLNFGHYDDDATEQGFLKSIIKRIAEKGKIEKKLTDKKNKKKKKKENSPDPEVIQAINDSI